MTHPTHLPLVNYDKGRAWYTFLVGSALAYRAHEDELARSALDQAELIISPLGEEDEPELLRDFIAGAMRQAEETLSAEDELGCAQCDNRSDCGTGSDCSTGSDCENGADDSDCENGGEEGADTGGRSAAILDFPNA